MRKVYTILLTVVLVVVPALVALGWQTMQSAFAACADGQVTITVSFTNTDNKSMNVVATDEGTGLSVDLGSVAAGGSASDEITTGLSSVGDGQVRFDTTWTSGKKGSDAFYAGYTGAECEEPPPPPTRPDIKVESVCDVGVVFSWEARPDLVDRSVVVGSATFLGQSSITVAGEIVAPFGDTYIVGVLNTGGDEFVEWEYPELSGEYPEPAECTPTTTTPPPTTPPTEPPPTEPPTTPTQPPAAPSSTVAPAPDGGMESGRNPWPVFTGLGLLVVGLGWIAVRGRHETETS